MSNGKQAKVQKETRDYRRFIEESFPVKEVGVASAKEKNIRHGHISTLHIWWARRPLAASRATAYAALTPAPKDAEEWQKKRDFIIQLSQWENSNNQSLLERARREILEANGGVPPKVLDPFSGGGSYPLEALRLGCDSYANDYNPVAVLIEKATLEYPQKFGRPFEGMPEWAKSQRASQKVERGGKKNGKDEQPALFDPTTASDTTDFNPLLNAVRYWGKWVLEEAQKELADFYPLDSDGNIPIFYIWSHTIPCQNPACGIEIPLVRQFWLAKRDKKKVALYPEVTKGKLEFRIIGDGYEKWVEGFNPDYGTVSDAVAICPVCKSMIDADTNRRLFQEGASGMTILAIVLAKKSSARSDQGKHFRVATINDKKTFESSQEILNKKREFLKVKWGIDPSPDELLPTERAQGSSGFRILLYGMKKWEDIFNARQKLALITFIEIVQRAHEKMKVNGIDSEFAKAVMTYLAIGVDRLSTFNSILSWWQPAGEFAVNLFGRQALPMVWDFVEVNPYGEASGDWSSALDWIGRVIEQFSQTNNNPATVTQSSATNLPYPDKFFDAILTDPPYYDNVAYSDLSDFFYVWLKRSIGYLYPDLFSTPVAPKANEIIQDPARKKDKEFFETKLTLAFKEIHRILRPNGLAVIVYAHKSTEGWETLVNSLLQSSLVVTGAWPLHTERQSRFVANQSASLASSIYIIARKISRQPTGFYNDVRAELTQHLDAKLHRLWEEGIGGGDFFIAAIGSAIEVFGKYEQVMDFEGNIVRADRLLEEVRLIATNYAVKQILHNGFAAEITPLTRFYVLWRWNYGEALVPFDEANKLAHSCGLDLSLQFSKNGFIKKEKEFVRMLGPQGRKLDDLDDPRDMIDVLHKTLLLWEKGQRNEMVKALAESGFGRSEAFYRVAQAISETLPNESKEKKLLDGFLAGRERVQEAVEKEGSQGRLFE